jgi:hypothetical protein
MSGATSTATITSPFKITSSEYPYCTIEHLACYSPSISIYNWTEERHRRQQHIQDAIDIARLCRFNLQVISAASTYIHRYYLRHSIIDGERGTSHIELIGAALLLASKSEDTPRRLNDFLESLSDAAQSVLKKRGIEYKAYIRDTVEFSDFRDHVVSLETLMLCTLEYDFHVQHVHEYACCLTKQLFAVYSTDQSVMDDLVECIFELSIASLRSTICLHWHVQAIAVTILFLSAALTERDVQAASQSNNICTDEDPWYHICGVSGNDIFQITTQLLANADQTSDIIQKLNDTSVWKKYFIRKAKPQTQSLHAHAHADVDADVKQQSPQGQRQLQDEQQAKMPTPHASPSASHRASPSSTPRYEQRYEDRPKSHERYQRHVDSGKLHYRQHDANSPHTSRYNDKQAAAASRHHPYDSRHMTGNDAAYNQQGYKHRYHDNRSQRSYDVRHYPQASRDSRGDDKRHPDNANHRPYTDKHTQHKQSYDAHGSNESNDGQPASYHSRDDTHPPPLSESQSHSHTQTQNSKVIDLTSKLPLHHHPHQQNGYDNNRMIDPIRIGMPETTRHENGNGNGNGNAGMHRKHDVNTVTQRQHQQPHLHHQGQQRYMKRSRETYKPPTLSP